MKRILFFIATGAIVFSCRQAPQLSNEVQAWQEQAQDITIMRDDFGVPHIYGKTDADAVFGLLYAQAEDDFNRVEQNYIWATGRLAEVEGEEALYSDLRAKLYMTEEEAKANYEKSPDWLKELCNAFADGLNYYLYTHPEVKPRLLTHFEPWMPFYFSEGSIGGDIERVRTAKIKALYENGAEVPAESQLAWQLAEAELEPQGSNGIAISGKLTQSGNTLLLINPHTSFYFRGEVHVVSEEGLNAYGAVTWGQFFVYQGFNEKTGWMHTSTYTDVIDEFVETVENHDGNLVYKYGEEWRPVTQYDIPLKYLEDGQLKERTITGYRTHHGPITHQLDGQWVASALMWEPVNALQQSYIRSKQDGYKGFREMMDIRTNSSNNTVYADAEGNIAYFHGNYIPIRDQSFDYTQPVDGSNPQTDWQGLHPVDEAITLLNPENGWLQNCNSTPYTAALDYSPKKEDYPRYMSLDRENFRGVHAIDLLSKGKDYTLESLIDLAYDPYLPAFAKLIPGLIEAYDKNSSNQDLKEGIDILRNWDFKTSKESKAMTLSHYYGSLYSQKGNRPEGIHSDMELLTYFGVGSPLGERLSIFAEAVQQLESDFGKIPAWGEVNRFQRISNDIRQPFSDESPSTAAGLASGRWGALAAYGARYTNNTKKIYGTRGNSFVAVVEFGDKLKAKTSLAGGQSSDMASPHFDDQIQDYVDGKFKDVPFYREDVEKRAQETYSPGERQ